MSKRPKPTTDGCTFFWDWLAGERDENGYAICCTEHDHGYDDSGGDRLKIDNRMWLCMTKQIRWLRPTTWHLPFMASVMWPVVRILGSLFWPDKLTPKKLKWHEDDMKWSPLDGL